MQNKMKLIISDNERYLGQLNAANNKNGFDFYECKKDLYIGTFNNNSFEGYGMIAKQITDKRGINAGYHYSGRLNGLGISNDTNKTCFGYFNNDSFEAGVTFYNTGDIEFKFKKEKSKILSFIKSPIYNNYNYHFSLIKFENETEISKENSDVVFKTGLKYILQQRYSLAKFPSYDTILVKEADNSYYNGQSFKNWNKNGFGVISYENNNWKLVDCIINKIRTVIISKDDNKIDLNLGFAHLILFDDNKTKAILKYNNICFTIDNDIYTMEYAAEEIDEEEDYDDELFQERGVHSAYNNMKCNIIINSDFEIISKLLGDDYLSCEFQPKISFS